MIFNEEFQKLYEIAIGTNGISPDFIQMENIEFGFKNTQTVFYARDKTEYGCIYEQSLHVNRQILPSVCVRTRYKDTSSDVFNDNHYEDYNITDSMVLNSSFHQLLLFELKIEIYITYCKWDTRNDLSFIV